MTTTPHCVSALKLLHNRNHGNSVGFREWEDVNGNYFSVVLGIFSFTCNLNFLLKAWWQFPMLPKLTEAVMNKRFINWVNWIKGKMWKWPWHGVHKREVTYVVEIKILLYAAIYKSWTICGQHSAMVGGTATSQLQGPWAQVTVCAVFLCMFSHILVCFFWVPWVPPTSRHTSRWIGYAKLPLSVNECVIVCIHDVWWLTSHTGYIPISGHWG